MTSSENSVEGGRGNLDVKRRVREVREIKSGKGDEKKAKKGKEIEGN